MTYLIDTHVLIWYVSGNSRLSKKFIEEIKNQRNTILISNASLWEIAIKVSLKKLEIGISFSDLGQYLRRNNSVELSFKHIDLQQMISLPFHHYDPFDRLIISQALAQDLTVISDDPKFNLYPVRLLSSK